MAKTLNFTFQGEDFTLEYTRDTVRIMENTGFKVDDLFNMPMNMIPQLFYGAFLAHHKGIKRKKVDAIYDAITQRGDLIAKLAEMYREPLSTLIDEPEEDEGNVSWTASF